MSMQLTQRSRKSHGNDKPMLNRGKIVVDLHVACQERPLRCETIASLVASFKNAIDVAGEDGWLPIHRVCRRDPSLAIIMCLVNPWPGSLWKYTGDGIKALGARLPLHLACQFNASLDVIKYLVQMQPRTINKPCRNHSMTPLEYAYQYQDENLPCSNNAAVIDFLESSVPSFRRKPRKPPTTLVLDVAVAAPNDADDSASFITTQTEEDLGVDQDGQASVRPGMLLTQPPFVQDALDIGRQDEPDDNTNVRPRIGFQLMIDNRSAQQASTAESGGAGTTDRSSGSVGSPNVVMSAAEEPGDCALCPSSSSSLSETSIGQGGNASARIHPVPIGPSRPNLGDAAIKALSKTKVPRQTSDTTATTVPMDAEGDSGDERGSCTRDRAFSLSTTDDEREERLDGGGFDCTMDKTKENATTSGQREQSAGYASANPQTDLVCCSSSIQVSADAQKKLNHGVADCNFNSEDDQKNYVSSDQILLLATPIPPAAAGGEDSNKDKDQSKRERAAVTAHSVKAPTAPPETVVSPTFRSAQHPSPVTPPPEKQASEPSRRPSSPMSQTTLLHQVTDEVIAYTAPVHLRQSGAEPAGTCPSGRLSIRKQDHKQCPGFNPPCSVISLLYKIPAGSQMSYHYHPTKTYPATERNAFLPNNAEGRKLLTRLKYAWTHGLIFSVGYSQTCRQHDLVVWTGKIPHKTVLNGSGEFAFPDSAYLQRCNASLDAEGVPAADTILRGGGCASHQSRPRSSKGSTPLYRSAVTSLVPVAPPSTPVAYSPTVCPLPPPASPVSPRFPCSQLITSFQEVKHRYDPKRIQSSALKRWTAFSPPGTLHIKAVNDICPGFGPNTTCIQFRYMMDGGVQQKYHPSPGKRFQGTTRLAYLPLNETGVALMHRLVYAWNKGWIFEIGKSKTSRQSGVIVWSSAIPHRTSLSGGAFGFPDASYLAQCNDALDRLEVPVNPLTP